jgi:hypothetical protein
LDVAWLSAGVSASAVVCVEVAMDAAVVDAVVAFSAGWLADADAAVLSAAFSLAETWDLAELLDFESGFNPVLRFMSFSADIVSSCPLL